MLFYSGCINDANYLKFLLLSKFGFLEQNLLVLTDDAVCECHYVGDTLY